MRIRTRPKGWLRHLKTIQVLVRKDIAISWSIFASWKFTLRFLLHVTVRVGLGHEFINWFKLIWIEWKAIAISWKCIWILEIPITFCVWLYVFDGRTWIYKLIVSPELLRQWRKKITWLFMCAYVSFTESLPFVIHIFIFFKLPFENKLNLKFESR